MNEWSDPYEATDGHVGARRHYDGRSHEVVAVSVEKLAEMTAAWDEAHPPVAGPVPRRRRIPGMDAFRSPVYEQPAGSSDLVPERVVVERETRVVVRHSRMVAWVALCVATVEPLLWRFL